MDEYPPLVINANLEIASLPKDKSYFLNKTTFLYGASDSGKSTILREILFLIKDDVPLISVYCPTAESNDAYSGIVPDRLINLNASVDKIKSTYVRQQAATKLYNNVNRMSVLRSLFMKIPHHHRQKADAVIENINNMSRTLIQRCENERKSRRIKLTTQIKKKATDKIRAVYKTSIRKHRACYDTSISSDEKYSLKYLDFNPRCVIVLDDCGAEIKKWQKDPIIKKILMQGRHDHINLIVTLQDDKDVDSSLKKNVFVNIFTTPQCANAYFGRSSNNFSKEEKTRAMTCIDHVFRGDHFRKFVYVRGDSEPLRYMQADLYEPFRFGSPAMWEFCAKLSNKEPQQNMENDPSLSMFKI